MDEINLRLSWSNDDEVKALFLSLYKLSCQPCVSDTAIAYSLTNAASLVAYYMVERGIVSQKWVDEKIKDIDNNLDSSLPPLRPPR